MVNDRENLVIREYSTSAKEAILAIFTLNTPMYFSPEEQSDLIAYLDDEIENYYILEFNKEIIGSGGINFSDDKSIAIISWDLLHPNFQGMTFGSQLLKYRIQKILTTTSAQKIIVRTSQLTYRFYEKQGFVLNETIKDYWAKGFDLYRMEYVQINMKD